MFTYDNSCNVHKNVLKQFIIDTDIQDAVNHTISLSQKGQHADLWAEKTILRKLPATLAYCFFKNYQNKVKLFFIMNNYEETGVL